MWKYYQDDDDDTSSIWTDASSMFEYCAPGEQQNRRWLSLRHHHLHRLMKTTISYLQTRLALILDMTTGTNDKSIAAYTVTENAFCGVSDLYHLSSLTIIFETTPPKG
jgi:hypothetical protein